MIDHLSVMDAIAKRRSLKLSEAEIDALRSAPDDFAPAHSILAALAFNSADYDTAIKHAFRAYELDPKNETAVSLVSSLSRAGRVEDAIAFAKSGKTALEHVARAGILAELYGRNGQADENKKWSAKALRLKEAEARIIPDLPEPKLARFSMEKPSRNIISFSLWGDNPRYTESAIRNCIVARYLYPGWTPRFYVDSSLPDTVRKALSQEGAQLKEVPGLPAHKYGLFWRFLVEDDPDVDLYIVRDADCVMSLRERMAVEDWLASRQPFHVMRDYKTHSELVLAGLWGAHRGNIPDMGKRILAFAKSRKNILNSRVEDQLFLRREAWPFMRGRTFVQDSAFGYGESAPFDTRFPNPPNRHVGQDDFAARRNLRGARKQVLRANKSQPKTG